MFGRTLIAFAADRFDVVVEIRLAVVNGDLLSGCDLPQRPDPDAFAMRVAFGVGSARVIDIAREIAARTAVNRTLLIKLKEILPASLCYFFTGQNRTDIFDNLFIGWNQFQCK